MTADHHLPASAASVLLGTALLLACAPKAQAAEKTQDDTTNPTKFELVQENNTEPQKIPASDQTTEKQETAVKPDADQKEVEEGSTPLVAAHSDASKVMAKTGEEVTQNADTKKAAVKDVKAKAKQQAEDSKEKELPANVKSALDYFFKRYKFLALPVDTAKGVVPDPRAVLANADEMGVPIVWRDQPDVTDLGAHPATIKITLSTEDGYHYDVEIPTTVTVHEKESDYAMVYGTPGPNKIRTTSAYYDVEQQKLIAKRIFYLDPADRYADGMGETFSAMNETGADWEQIGYVKGTDKYTVPDDSGLIHEAEDQANLNEEEKRSFERFYNLAHQWGWGHYENYPSSIRILTDNNNIWFVAAAHSRDLPDNSAPMQGYWDPDHFDFTNGHLPDPRYFIKNFELMPVGTKAEWAVAPRVNENGLQNDPVIRVTTPDGNTTLVNYNAGNGFAKFGDFELADPNGVILKGDIPQVEVGNLPDPKRFFKSYKLDGSGQEIDPAQIHWVIKPDVTQAGYTHGCIRLPSGEQFMVFLDVVPKKTDPKPKPDPDPNPDPIPVPTPDPDPDPKPKPDPKPDIADDPEKDPDEDQPEDKQPEKKQAKQTTKSFVVEKKVTKPVVQTKRTALPQTGSKNLLVLAFGAAVSIIGLGFLRKKKYR